MSLDHAVKYIYPNSDKPSLVGQAHILVGHCPDTLEYYHKLAEILRKDFPDAEDSEIGCHKIHTSDRVKGFTLLAWTPKREVVIWPELEGVLETDEPLPDEDKFDDSTIRPKRGDWDVCSWSCCHYGY